MRILSDSERDQALQALRGWDVEGPILMKTFELSNQGQVEDFADDLGMVAEASEHPVAVEVRDKTVRVTVGAGNLQWGGLTDRDVAVAHAVERCYTEQIPGS